MVATSRLSDQVQAYILLLYLLFYCTSQVLWFLQTEVKTLINKDPHYHLLHCGGLEQNLRYLQGMPVEHPWIQESRVIYFRNSVLQFGPITQILCTSISSSVKQEKIPAILQAIVQIIRENSCKSIIPVLPLGNFKNIYSMYGQIFYISISIPDFLKYEYYFN